MKNKIIFKTLMLKGEAGSTIVSMEKTGHVGTADIYTITFNDGSTTEISLENMSAITSVEKTSSTDTEDIYTITCADGSTQTFSVLNHNADFAAMSEDIDTIDARVDNFINSVVPNTVETLWTGSIKDVGDSATLSNAVSNFDYIDLYLLGSADSKYIRVPATQTAVNIQQQNLSDDASSNFLRLWEMGVSISGSTVSITKSIAWAWDDPNNSNPTVTANAQNGVPITRIDGVKVASDTPAEVTDIRVGADGTTYNSAGAAVRGQISDLKNTLSYNYIPYTTGTNLFDKDNSDNLCDGYYVSYSNGIKHANESITMFIVPIDAEKGKLSLNSMWANIAFTSEYVQLSSASVEVAVNGYISGVAGSSSPLEGFTIPSNAKYVIVSITTSQIATAQLQYGETCTAYEPYKNFIDGQEIKKRSIPLDAIERTAYTVDINGGGDYTSLLEALKNTPNNATIHVRQGTYNVIEEYESFYGSDFWDNYDSYNNHSDDPFYRGYWITDGRIIDCDANALFTFDYTGTNTNVKTYFSPFAIGKQATLKGVNVSFTNTCRYAVHDDFAGYTSGTPEGINTIENCVFDGGATAIGGGCGKSNTYVINNCIFLNGISNTNIFYHNNVNAGAKNKLFVSNCYGNKGLEFRYYGASIKISECMASSCMFDHISCVAQAGDNSNNVNMVLYKINCTETGSAS